jgi:hypothetical protein
METVLYLMVGLPYAGKTTWCRNANTPTIEVDALRRSLYGLEYVERMEPYVIWLSSVFALTLLQRHHRVFVDDTFGTPARRMHFFFPGVVTHMVWCDADEATCLRRAPEEHHARIREVAGMFQAPDASEWERWGKPFITIFH